MSNLPVTSETSRTSSILNNSFRTLSLSLESMLIPVRALTLNPSASSLITIVNFLINPFLSSLLILLYTTEAFMLIFFESLGTDVLASFESSLNIFKSKSSILAIQIIYIIPLVQRLINVLISHLEPFFMNNIKIKAYFFVSIAQQVIQRPLQIPFFRYAIIRHI